MTFNASHASIKWLLKNSNHTLPVNSIHTGKVFLHCEFSYAFPYDVFLNESHTTFITAKWFFT